MTCIVVGTKVFDCSTPDDPLTQRVYHFLGLTDDVNRAGSEWGRSPTTNLGLFQSDYFVESLSNTLVLIDTAAAVRDLPALASNVVSFGENVTTSGGRIVGDTTPISAIFDSNTSAGMVVYVSSNGHVDLARADVVGTSAGVGLALSAVTATQVGEYKPEGQITLSDWTAVTGTTTLSAGAIYFLSETTAGQMTTTPPTLSGETILRVGRALTDTQFDIEIAQPVLL